MRQDLSARSPSPVAKTSRLTVTYEEAGEGSNVLVLVHGNFASARWWRPVLDRLPPGTRALAPVLRGCAGTIADERGFDIPELADDLHAFVESLGLETFQLVGHSLGGAVAMQYALDHPDRVTSLVLVATAPAAGLAPMREGSSKAARMLRMMDPEHAPSMGLFAFSYGMHRSLGTNRRMLRDALAAMMPSLPAKGAAFEALVDDAAHLGPDAVVGYLRALHRWNVERELHRVRVPALVLAGGKDTVVPYAALQRTAALLPFGELVTWPDVGHAPMLEAPEELTRLLVDFAQRAAPARRTWTWLWALLAALRAVVGRPAVPARQLDP